jgi:chaperonin cofactor prefoldin
VSAHTSEIPYRRIGTILVEWRLITEEQLTHALTEQEETGRLLGEILVTSYGVSRVDLADALAEQWQEANRAATAAIERNTAAEVPSTEDGELAEADLRVLLDEAEAARTELTARTEELSRRLATLETLVIGVSAALEELRSAGGKVDAPERQAHQGQGGTRRSHGRSGARRQRPVTPS